MVDLKVLLVEGLLVIFMITNLVWVTDRTQSDIDKVKVQFDYSEESLDRATLSHRVINRYRSNMAEIKNALSSLGIGIDGWANISAVEANRDVTCTNPNKPVLYKGSLTDPVVPQYNPMYNIIQNSLQLFRKLDVDTTDLSIPQTTEYLHFKQINDLEKALSMSCDKINQLLSGTGIVYSGTTVAGGAM